MHLLKSFKIQVQILNDYKVIQWVLPYWLQRVFIFLIQTLKFQDFHIFDKCEEI